MIDSNPKNILPRVSTAEARKERYSQTGRITESDIKEYLNEVRQMLSRDYSGEDLEERLRVTEEKTRSQYAKELEASKSKPKKKKIPSKSKIDETDSILVVDKIDNIKKIKPQGNIDKPSSQPLGIKDLSRDVGSGGGVITRLGGSLFNRMFPTLGRFLNGVQARVARSERNLTETNASTQGYAQQVGRSSVFLSSMSENQTRTNELLQQIVNLSNGNTTQIPPPSTAASTNGQNAPRVTPTAAPAPQQVNRPQPGTTQTFQNTSASSAPASQQSTSGAVSAAGRAAIIGGGVIGGAALASSSASAAVNPRASLQTEQNSNAIQIARPTPTEQNSNAPQNRISSLNNTQTISSNATQLRNEPVSSQEDNNFSSRLLNINAREIVFKADKFEFDQPTNNMPSTNLNQSSSSQTNSFSPASFSQQSPSGGTSGNERLIRPTGGVVTSGFGQRAMGYHEGIDFGVPVGSPIVSSQSGTVVDVRSSSSYGNLVRVRGADGLETLYAHLSSVGVQPGQQVQQGQQIALSGNTGRSTGPHLHYEVIRDGRRVDPAPLIGAAGEAPRPTQEQNVADAPLTAPPNTATQVSSQPSTGAQIMQSSTQAEIASQQITISATETTPSINQPEQSDPASTMIDPNDPGSVEPNDSSQRYSRLFGVAA
jgi:murein DD-endopeptidase MepM/ murein hydrolase activator NlpD